MYSQIRKNFENAYATHSEPLFRHIYFRISNRERAIEIAQEVFMKTWDYLNKGNEIENIQAFIYKVSNNLIINEYQRRKIPLSIETLYENDGINPPSSENVVKDLEKEEDIKKVLNRLSSIKEEYREAIYMKYIDELSVKEIAEILNETESNVSVRIHRGLEKLKEIYKNYGE